MVVVVEGINSCSMNSFPHPLLSIGAKQGYLKKLGENMQWQWRYFVLSNNCLHYFDNEKQDRPTEIIPLEGLRVIRLVKDLEQVLNHFLLFF